MNNNPNEALSQLVFDLDIIQSRAELDINDGLAIMIEVTRKFDKIPPDNHDERLLWFHERDHIGRLINVVYAYMSKAINELEECEKILEPYWRMIKAQREAEKADA